MLLKYNRNLYSKDALLKAAFNFTDKAYIHLSQTENEYIVDFVVKEGNIVSEKEFDNEMIFQTMRHKVYLETADIRKIMVARAMASTIIDDEEPKPQTTDFMLMKSLQIGLKTMKTIEFDLNLYDQKCIKKAIDDFYDIAEIISEKCDNKIICRMLASKADINLTACEFSNYIIDLMNVI